MSDVITINYIYLMLYFILGFSLIFLNQLNKFIIKSRYNLKNQRCELCWLKCLIQQVPI